MLPPATQLQRSSGSRSPRVNTCVGFSTALEEVADVLILKSGRNAPTFLAQIKTSFASSQVQYPCIAPQLPAPAPLKVLRTKRETL